MKRIGEILPAFLLAAAALFVGCAKEQNGDASNTNTVVQVGELGVKLTTGDWVDLGLPSGLLWATRNVGASSPTDYGDYFAWGETSPKDSYDWDNYRYYRDDIDGRGFTKYCPRSDYGHNGFMDYLTTLQPEDDAATANYGGRMPTSSEWKELYNNTTSKWMTVYGVTGRCFTGCNGNSLFLPAAGGRGSMGSGYIDSFGYYWSSSLYAAYPYRAWGFHSGSRNVYWDYYGYYRFDGRSVRAVRAAR